MSTNTEQLSSEFLASMEALLGPEYPDYLASFEEPFYQGIRVNTGKISVEEFCRIAPFHLTPIPWTDNGFYITADDDVSRHPYYYAGLYYIQEPSAMVPASRIPVREGDFCLDLCAAPGGKSTELAARLHGTGCLLANDISNSRAKALLKNLELFGFGNIFVCSEAPEKLLKFYPEFFDKILIDAPCSGEGMFRKDSAMLKSYEEHGPEYYAAIQADILESAYQMLRPGGNLLFSTCTFSSIENEDNIHTFLQKHPDMHLIPMNGYSAFSQGCNKDGYDPEYHLEHCVRLFPHKLKGEGHFAALLAKDVRDTKPAARRTDKSKPTEEWMDFQKKVLKKPPFSGEFKQVGESLYLIPEDSFLKKQIRFLRTGLYLGDSKKKRFEPSQALAMYLKPDMVKQSLQLSISDIRVKKYLKGESLELTDEEDYKDGYILVCVDQYPLGWGKIVNGTLRNKYYSGWRMN